jgi:membrane fusion protein (multidrug efflux system)
MEEGKTELAKTPAPSSNRRRRSVLLFLGAVAVLLGGVWGYNQLFLAGSVTTDDAQLQANQAVIAAQTLGQIRELKVDQGDSVTKGQILAALDDRTQQVQRDQALLAIDQAKANLNQAAVNIDASAQRIRLNLVKLQQAQRDLDRAAAQYKVAVLSQEDYEHAKSAMDSAQATYEISLGEKREIEAQEKAAESQLRSAQAGLQAVDANMTHVILPATTDGVVARRWVVVGDVVQPAQPIYTVVDLKNLWVDANFKETQVRHLGLGDPVAVTVDAFPGVTIAGKVESIGAATAAAFALIPQDNTSGNYTKLSQRVPVRIALEPGIAVPAGRSRHAVLVPGMSVEVTVKTQGE